MILHCHLHLPFLYGFLYLISFFIFPEKRLNMVSTRNKTQMCFLAEKNLCPPESASFIYYVSGTKNS